MEVVCPLFAYSAIVELLPPDFGLTVKDGVELCWIHGLVVGGGVVECK